jgi:hypothetical protein
MGTAPAVIESSAGQKLAGGGSSRRRLGKSLGSAQHADGE